jgi:hypothetical protein
MTRSVKTTTKRITEKSGIKLEMAAISKRASMIDKVKAIADYTAVGEASMIDSETLPLYLSRVGIILPISSPSSAKSSTTRMSPSRDYDSPSTRG